MMAKHSLSLTEETRTDKVEQLPVLVWRLTEGAASKKAISNLFLSVGQALLHARRYWSYFRLSKCQYNSARFVGAL